MKRLALPLLIAAFMLMGCGYDGHYRYPCQDPANWETADCQPPICIANGACPEDLIDLDVLNGTTTVTEETNE